MSKTVLADVDGFTPVIDDVMKDTSLITAVVFGRVWRYCQMPNGVCQASLDKIAGGIGLSKQAVIKHLKILEGKKYIEDATPCLRNRPHTYRDTGKAGLRLTLSALNNVYRETSSTLNDVDSALNVDDSHVKQRLIEDSIKKPLKKEIHIRGIEAAIATGRSVTEDDFIPENNPPAKVLERLSVLNRNWHKYGENQKWDHLARQIVDAEKCHPGMVEEFVIWVHKQKDPATAIKYYGIRPDYIWNDFGLCFSDHKQLSVYQQAQAIVAREEREYKEAHGRQV